ncbi:MAG: crossover junction endodeoxyribonuclease RuvC [Planctomycetes bacterium]|jgi:crossover junction endodeoxyribonuclease RuvC|nr:crossover junction endodeoxyribonuclease RuvC [Planctomycetota bacterium]MCP4839033.1 crossover junction endodeoxyribonuclease RuvC [Planctomycetota bacterium]
MKGTLRVLGIDPGLRYTGYGCIEVDETGTATKVIEAGVIRVPQRKPLPARLAFLHDSLTTLMIDTTPTLVVIESVFVHRERAQTAMQMGHARGVMLLTAEQRSIAIDELSPAEVKRAVTGSGRASKEQVQHAVAALLGLSQVPDQPDTADALAVALAAAQRAVSPRGSGESEVGSR